MSHVQANGINIEYDCFGSPGDRRELLRSITAPTLVVHGKVDLLPAANGQEN